VAKPDDRDFAEHRRATAASAGDLDDLEGDAAGWDRAEAVEAAASEARSAVEALVDALDAYGKTLD
jgi:hypothetical protein